MKRIITVFVICVMLACAILPVAVSADVLWTDDFSSAKQNDWIWDEDTTKFFVENGKLEGWAEAVVHQSNFLVDRGAPRRYKECAWKIECAGLEDGGRDVDEHGLSIWFADYISPYGDPDGTTGTISYNWGYNFEKKILTLNVGFDNDGEDYKPADYPIDGPYITVSVPDSEAPYMDANGGCPFTLGMRIANGKASFYMNDKKYAEINAFRGTKTCTEVGSPLLVFNGGCHCTFDNLVVATADYNLFNESDTPETETQKVIETVIVHDTDENGNDVTRVETQEVVRVAPSTGSGSSVGTATRTGDAAIIVLCVMIVSLGGALVVWKVRSR